MNRMCQKPFADEWLSGYLDGELTQAESQRVRIHLENCPECRETWQALQALREASMNTSFREPSPEEWGERPHGPLSRVFRSLGWLLLVLWGVVTLSYALWQLAVGPEGLLVKVLVFGGGLALVLLLASAIVDRVRTWGRDRYKGVQR